MFGSNLVANRITSPQRELRIVLSGKILESSLLYQSAEYIVSFEDSADYLVNAEIGIEAPLSSMVNLVISVRDYYINQPAEGRERNDVYTITGLKVNL
jgi:hypothetical protein